ncbi:MAG: alginate export family protein [Planctomycetota bacterium]
MPKTTIPLVLALVFAAAVPLAAQPEDKQHIEEEFRREIEQQEQTRREYYQPLLWDVGGWMRFNFVTFGDEPTREDRTFRLADLRIFGQARILDEVDVYVRIRNQYTDWNSGDQYTGDDDNKDKFLRLDQAHLSATLEDFLGTGSETTFRLGRQFVQLGRGLVLNNVSDGLQVTTKSGIWTGKLIGTRANPSEDDIDSTHPDHHHMRRAFIGGEVGYLGFDLQRVYLIGMAQIDLMREDPQDFAQDYGYDSFYVGVGGRGTILTGLSYQAEAVYEFGEGIATGSKDEEDIRAFALTGSLFYQPGWDYDPLFSAEYYLGSGDGDRTSVTDTVGGNTPGTDDEGFLGFGYLMTGYSLFPRLSNLHIVKASATVVAVRGEEYFNTVQVGTAVYGYMKQDDGGAISDTRASEDERQVGWEFDVYLRWRAFSDVGMTVNYGVFFPGDAYPSDSDDTRHYISVGVTYGF